MKQILWRKLSLILATVLLLSLLPLSVWAESAAPDGIKEAAYTEEKSLKINTTYSGQGGDIRDNPYEVSTETFYYWDDSYVYVWMDVHDGYNSTGVCMLDVLYVRAGTAIGGAMFENGGMEWSYNKDTGAYGCSNTVLEYAAAVSPAAGVRSYEFRFPHNGADGFLIHPVAYGAANYTVSYASHYLNSGVAKAVSFTDATTWKDTSAFSGGDLPDEPDEPGPSEDDTLPDGVKDAAYTDSKKVKINTAYAGDRGAAIDNIYQVSSETFYYWDDTYVYVWMDVHDGYNSTGVCMLDVLYYRPDLATDIPIFSGDGGAFTATVASGSIAMDHSDSWAVAAGPTGNGIRSYEFRFPRGTAEGFTINPVAYGSSTYTVTYQSSYQMANDGKQVLFNDESTWLDTSAFEESETPEQPGIQEDPNGWVDGVKEAAYTEEKMVEISNAFTGQGGFKTTNTNHIYSRIYYYWDDTNVYFWWDIYDPDGLIQIDAVYWVDGTTGIGPIFNFSNGGEASFKPASGVLTNGKNNLFSMVSAQTAEGATRSYEMSFEYHAEGFAIQPVCYINPYYTVSYQAGYFAVDSAKIVLFNDPSTYTDRNAVDINVITDFSKLEPVKAAMERLPEDPSSLQETDRTLVDEVQAVVETVPAGWLNAVDPALLARYKGALQRMLALKALAKAAEIQAVEQLIRDLPEMVDLSHTDAVAQAQSAFQALADVSPFVDTALQQKLTDAVVRLETLQAPVKIDGILDPAYQEGQDFEINFEFGYASASSVLGTMPDTYGHFYTMTDADYIYMYVEVWDASIVPYPTDAGWLSSFETSYDGIITYFNPDPGNDPSASPIRNSYDEATKDFSFYMLADGTVPSDYIIEGKNDFLTDRASFASFTKTGSYGYEVRIPRVAYEETFLLNFVIIDPVYTVNDAEESVLDYDASRMIALGGEWYANYVQYAELYFEDYPQLKNYNEVIALIDSLPAADTITNAACKPTADAARKALELLNEDQRTMVSQEAEAKLAAVEERLANLSPAPAVSYGDLDRNGKVDAADALIVLKIAVGKQTADDSMKAAADVSNDSKIDAADALLILKKAVGKLNTFPVEDVSQ